MPIGLSQPSAICTYPKPDQTNLRPPHYSLKISFVTIIPSMPRSTQWSLSPFPTKNFYAPPVSLKLATCHVYLILIDFITQMILGENNRSYLFSLYPCVFLRPKYFLSTNSHLTHSLYDCLNVTDDV